MDKSVKNEVEKELEHRDIDKKSINTLVINTKEYEHNKMYDVDPYLEVSDSGIMEIIQESNDGKQKIGKIIIPREIFKEAYERYCKEE